MHTICRLPCCPVGGVLYRRRRVSFTGTHGTLQSMSLLSHTNKLVIGTNTFLAPLQGLSVLFVEEPGCLKECRWCSISTWTQQGNREPLNCDASNRCAGGAMKLRWRIQIFQWKTLMC